MTTVEKICSHSVMFHYKSRSKHAIPNEAEIQHVTEQINQNMTSGELCMVKVINNREYEFRGWWNIVKNCGKVELTVKRIN